MKVAQVSGTDPESFVWLVRGEGEGVENLDIFFASVITLVIIFFRG